MSDAKITLASHTVSVQIAGADAARAAQADRLLAQAAVADAALEVAKAQQWAEEPEDSEVEAGQFSALHWATKAAAALSGVKYQTVKAKRLSGDIVRMDAFSGGGTAGTAVGNRATVPDGHANIVTLDLGDVAAGENVTVLLRTISGESHATAFRHPNAIPSETYNERGTPTRMDLQADGTWLITIPPTYNGAEAPQIVLKVEPAAGADWVFDVYIFEGDAVPSQIDIPQAATDAINKSVADKLTREQTIGLIDEYAPLSIAGNEQLIASIMRRLEADQKPRIYVSAKAGLDTNAGTLAAPVKTPAYATSLSTNIDLKTGDIFPVTLPVTVGNSSTPGDLSQYGSGQNKPVIDGRRDIGALSWTADGADLWYVDLTLAEALTVGGLGVNFTTLALYHAPDRANDLVGAKLALKWDGADIAANKEAVRGEAGSFTWHVQGETDPDPRTGASTSPAIRVYARPADGNTPDGQPLLLTAARTLLTCQGGSVSGVTVIGQNWKDAASAKALGVGASAVFPVFADFTALETLGHGVVGPATIEGIYKVTGRIVEGDPTGFKGTSGYVAYTADDWSLTHDLILNAQFEVDEKRAAIYAHRGNQPYAYRSVIMPEGASLRGFGNDIAFQLEEATGRPGAKVVTRNTYLKDHRLYLVQCGEGQDWLHEGGYIELGGDETFNSANRQALVRFLGDATVTLKDLEWEMNASTTLGDRRVTLAHRIGNFDCRLIFDNCHDRTEVRRINVAEDRWVYKAYLIQTNLGGNAGAIHIEIRNGSTLGSLQTRPADAPYMASLTVEAGCTFGIGDRTGPQIIAALDAAGIPHDISNDTTIVDTKGKVLSEPGW